MENCTGHFTHFTIRGAVAEFRKRDWRLNFPFPVSQELRLEQIDSLLPPLDTPKFKWWYCKSCVQELTEHICPHIVTGTSVRPSDAEFVTSNVDKFTVYASVAINTDAGNLDKVEGTALNKHHMESEHPKSSAVCHASKYGFLIKGKPEVMFDLNEPTIEINALATEELTFKDSECQIINTASVNAHQRTGNKEDSGALPISNAVGNCNSGPSADVETVDSSKGADDVLTPDGDASKKRRTPKYRALSELLKSGGENPENVQFNVATDIVPTPDLKLCKISNSRTKRIRKQLKIQREQGSGISKSVSKDEARINETNGAIDFSPPIRKNNFLRSENLSHSSVRHDKRQHHRSLSQDEFFVTVIPQSSQRGAVASLNETGRLVLPKKRRIYGDEVSKTHNDTEKSRQKICSTSLNEEQSFSPVIDHGDSFPIQLRMLGAQRRKKNHTSSVSEKRPDKRADIFANELLMGRRPIMSSPLFPRDDALTGMDLLSMAAAESEDIDTLSESPMSGGILPNSCDQRRSISFSRI